MDGGWGVREGFVVGVEIVNEILYRVVGSSVVERKTVVAM